MDFVAVDLGASSTRYTSDFGKISVMPNNMVFLEPDKFVDINPYDNHITSCLEVIIRKESTNGIEDKTYPLKALIGEIAERYSKINERPTSLTHKHKQNINYVSGLVAIALSKLAYPNMSDKVKLFVALPPIEVKDYRDYVKERFVGKYTIEFVKFDGGKTVEFEIDDVSCYEESFMAITSYFIDINGTFNEIAKKYNTGNILSLDIGASTTDLAIVKDCKYLDKSGKTYRSGGNLARDALIGKISSEFGYELPVDDANTVMSEGRLQLGNSYVDVSRLVQESKKEYAESIVLQIQGYFKLVDIPIQAIRAIVVSGGGSLQSQYIDENNETVETSKPMSEYITEELKKICSGVDVVQIDDSPRLANIKGLYIRAKFDMIKSAKVASNESNSGN